jgi:hypothetical protein
MVPVVPAAIMGGLGRGFTPVTGQRAQQTVAAVSPVDDALLGQNFWPALAEDFHESEGDLPVFGESFGADQRGQFLKVQPFRIDMVHEPPKGCGKQ